MSNLSPNYNPKSSNDQLHVAVFAFPFATHATPLFNITKRLASFAPTIIFSFFSTNESNNKTFLGCKDEILLPNIKAYDVWDGMPKGYVFNGNPQEPIELFMVSAPGSLRKAVAEAEEEKGRKVSCMIGDSFLWFVVEMAEEKGVPWVPVYMSEEHSLAVHFYTDLIREKIGIQGIAEQRKDELLEFVPGMSKFRVRDLPDGIVMGNFGSFFSKMLHQMAQVLPRAAAVCVSTCAELNSAVLDDLKSKLPNLLCLGPLSLMMPPPKTPDTNNCLVWLDKQQEGHNKAEVVYVSFGSIARPSPSEIAALAQGLEASGVKFIWSLRDDLKEHLPHGFLESSRKNGMLVSWAPQTDILAHDAVGVFITHFGHNSVMESVASGVPLIGRPFHGEQMLNGRLVEAVWEIGLEVEGGVLTKDGVVKSLEKILHGDEGKKMRENVSGLRSLVEKAISSKGSCNEDFKKLLEVVNKSC
ncbi:anthocyanidin 3-O-glucosyltransferase 7-like [Chenopodium quinoa]|uniref:anthocyanidin 3-O-glucosyltransferase 7-like n=1 Tax=Chenopodium quinoa TaxID=63459 RepID=UPI000B79831F|nr:anthocyanidin 3-O-glucosyltransferase 7-like [Chenopodium quinoa]